MPRPFLLTSLFGLAVVGCASALTPPTAPAPVDTAASVADAVGTPPPVTIADRTHLDEAGGLAVEVGARLAADLATTAVRGNLVPAARLAELRERVAWLRAAVGAVRAAYEAGNAASYTAALASARCALDRVRTLATGKPDLACPAPGEPR